MVSVAPYILLQCLGALLAWALIAYRERSERVLVEAGAVWLMPLFVAAAGGLPADTLVGIASCGIVFNLVSWLYRGVLRAFD
jgi:hypothetical protein